MVEIVPLATKEQYLRHGIQTLEFKTILKINLLCFFEFNKMPSFTELYLNVDHFQTKKMIMQTFH